MTPLVKVCATTLERDARTTDPSAGTGTHQRNPTRVQPTQPRGNATCPHSHHRNHNGPNSTR
jgi:hypothetical protein